MVAAGEVDAGDLQVTTVQVTLVQRDGAVDGYLLEASAAHAVVRAGDHGAGGFIGEADGAILCVVDGSPNAGFCLDACLVTIGIEDGREAEVGFIFCTGDVRVLVQRISCVLCAACHAGALFESGGAVAHVVVVIAVGFTIHLCTGKLGAGVVHEGIVHHVTLA